MEDFVSNKKNNKNKISMGMLIFASSNIFILLSKEGSFTFQSIIIPFLCMVIYTIIENKKIKIDKTIKLFALLQIVYVFSFLLNYIKYNCDGSVLIQLIYQIMIFFWFLMIAQRTYTRKEIKFYVDSYIFIACICCIYVLYFNIFKNIKIFSIKSFFGSTIDKNYFSAFICFAPIFCMINILSNDKKVFNIIAFCILLLGLFFTNSRGGLLALSIGIAVLLVYYLKDNISIKRILIILVSILLLILSIKPMLKLLPTWMYNRYFIDSYSDNSNKDRVLRWKNAINGIKEQPIFGFGPGIFFYIPEYHITEYGVSINTTTYAHNTYLDIAVNGGIVSLIIFLLLLTNLFIDLQKYNKIYNSIFAALIITSGILGAYKAVYFWNIIIFLKIIIEYSKENSKTIY